VHVARGPKGQMRFYTQVARLHAVSHAIAGEIVAEAPRLQDRVRVIPNALPFRVDRAVRLAGEQTILFVGRIHPEKGLNLFLRALPYLPREMLAAWNIRIVGPHETHLGGGSASFLRKLQALGERSGARIEWPGQIFDPERLAEEYRNSLVFAYPSVAETGEAFGVAPIEAMAYGCAPFVSNLACFRDYIEDGVTGFVFDQRAAEPEKHLATRLADLLGLGPEQIMRIGARARAKVAQFDLETVAQRYLEDFSSLLPNE
jgi:glycosyltransferase involved in cell wall biosynthesis